MLSQQLLTFPQKEAVPPRQLLSFPQVKEAVLPRQLLSSLLGKVAIPPRPLLSFLPAKEAVISRSLTPPRQVNLIILLGQSGRAAGIPPGTGPPSLPRRTAASPRKTSPPLVAPPQGSSNEEPNPKWVIYPLQQTLDTSSKVCSG